MANVDIRIRQVEPLATPRQVVSLLPVDEKTAESIRRSRQTVNDIIQGRDQRLLAIIGPCSLHDPDAALEYAQKLKKLASEIEDEMRYIAVPFFLLPRVMRR